MQATAEITNVSYKANGSIADKDNILLLKSPSKARLCNTNDSLVREFKRIVKNDNTKYRSMLESNKDLIEQVMKVRFQLVDWMVTVCSSLGQTVQTLCLSVEILDKILESYNFYLSCDDLHLIAVVSLFISSKYEEVRPISIGILLNKISHNKYLKEEVLSTELLILKRLHFKIPKTSYLDRLYALITLKDNEKPFPDNIKNLVHMYGLTVIKFLLADNFEKDFSGSRTTICAIVYISVLSTNTFPENEEAEIESVMRVAVTVGVKAKDVETCAKKISKKLKDLGKKDKNYSFIYKELSMVKE